MAISPRYKAVSSRLGAAFFNGLACSAWSTPDATSSEISAHVARSAR